MSAVNLKFLYGMEGWIQEGRAFGRFNRGYCHRLVKIYLVIVMHNVHVLLIILF